MNAVVSQIRRSRAQQGANDANSIVWRAETLRILLHVPVIMQTPDSEFKITYIDSAQTCLSCTRFKILSM
jgi:hypothetical protein